MRGHLLDTAARGQHCVVPGGCLTLISMMGDSVTLWSGEPSMSVWMKANILDRQRETYCPGSKELPVHVGMKKAKPEDREGF